MPGRKAHAVAAASNMGSKRRRWPSKASPGESQAGIDIRIENHYAAKIYTTGSSVTGEADIQVTRDTQFKRIAVQFAGMTATRNYMTPDIDQVLHYFLLLDMPPLDRHPQLPSDGILRTGQTYTLPFHFVVPDELPIGSCRQRCDHPSVREHHLRLPPSIGDWGDRDDGSPETAKIIYCVSVTVVQKRLFSSEPLSVLRCRREVNVLPAYTEDAPLEVGCKGTKSEYQLLSSKALRKSLMSRKMGTVVAEAAQPSAVVLTCDGREASPVKVTFGLTFSPSTRKAVSGDDAGGETEMPEIHSVSAKLIAKTYYNTSHMGAFPDRDRKHELNFGASLYYAESSRATGLRFDMAEGWKAQQTDGPKTWTTNLDAAFQLPIDQRKILLPTFHSCLISRVYTLRLTVSVGPGRTNITLSLPVQILIERGLPIMPPLRSVEEVGQDTHVAVAPPRYRDHHFSKKRFVNDIDACISIQNGIIM